MTQPDNTPVTPNSMPGANPQMAQPVSTAPPAPAPAPPNPPAPQQETQAPPPATTPPATDDDGKPDPDWKSHARTWEQRAKENAEAAKKWAEYEATQRTREENQAIALADAQRRAELAEAEAARERVARETGVLPTLLGGGTEEEMRAAAAAALAWRGESAAGTPTAPDSGCIGVHCDRC